ncbi:MAG: hypothetical protein KatS3mg087_2171 [Patescibacteria group bacterium]|nr:MAG: hypothetical protein KatS3mg087_2171 [Patescibacteria group bacterium]
MITKRNNIASASLVVLVLGFAIVGVSTIALVPEKYKAYLIGGVFMFGLVWILLRYTLASLYLLVITSAMAGIFRGFDELTTLSIGGTSVSLSGMRWIFLYLIMCFILVGNVGSFRIKKYHLTFWIFIIWSIFVWVLRGMHAIGVKDILFYSMPLIVFSYTYYVVFAKYGVSAVVKLERVFLLSFVIPIVLLIVTMSLGLVTYSYNGPKGVINPRPLASYLVLVCALGFSVWRYASTSSMKRLGRVVAVFSFLTVLFTLSRMASATALMLLVLYKSNPDKLWKMAGYIAVACLISIVVIFNIPGFQERFFVDKPRDVSEVFENLNTSGRATLLWPSAWDSALKRPIIGWGPGEARLVVADAIYYREVDEYHPHSEPLQIFHDLGIIGFILFLMTWIVLLIRYRRMWRFGNLIRDFEVAKWAMASTLAILVVLINSLVDNTLHYPIVMGPLALLFASAEYVYSIRQSKNA